MYNLQDFADNVNKVAKNMKLKDNVLNNLYQNIIALQELEFKDKSVMETLLESNNKLITKFSIINNSTNGFVINKDFWLLPFGKGKGSKMVEVKTANAWKQLALKYGIRKPKGIIIHVLFKNDIPTTGLDEFGNFILKDLKLDFDQDRTNYDDVTMVFGIINYEDGFKTTRFYNKSEIDKLKDKSPSANGNSASFSPWNNFPVKMIESKITRDLVNREIMLDNEKMYAAGYKFIDDEMTLKVDENDQENIIQEFDDSLTKEGQEIKQIESNVAFNEEVKEFIKELKNNPNRDEILKDTYVTLEKNGLTRTTKNIEADLISQGQHYLLELKKLIKKDEVKENEQDWINEPNA